MGDRPFPTTASWRALLLSGIAFGLPSSVLFSCGQHGESAPGTKSPLGGAAGGPFPGLEEAPLYEEGGTPPSELRLVFRPIAIEEVDSATDFTFLPAEGDLKRSRLLLLSRDNSVHLIELFEGVATVSKSWGFEDDTYFRESCAPTNIVLDPAFEDNRFVYVTKCADVETTQLLRFSFDEDAGLIRPRVIVETRGPGEVVGWHRMGSMGFEDEDVLWLLVGDHDDLSVRDDAQDLESPLGALVRLIPSRDPEGSGYRIPAGNLAGQPDAPNGVHPLIFSFGFRSPWRGTRDAEGRYWVGDVGRDEYEEVDLVRGPGENFGWNLHEGPCVGDCEGFVDPIVFYDRDPDHLYIKEGPGGEASTERAIWVGEIYDRPSVDRYETLMNGVVPFGDLFLGFVRGLRLDAEGALSMDAPIGLLQAVSTWKVGPDGYAYAADLFGNLHVALLDYEPPSP